MKNGGMTRLKKKCSLCVRGLFREIETSGKASFLAGSGPSTTPKHVAFSISAVGKVSQLTELSAENSTEEAVEFLITPTMTNLSFGASVLSDSKNLTRLGASSLCIISSQDQMGRTAELLGISSFVIRG
jgi:hypothetical protein